MRTLLASLALITACGDTPTDLVADDPAPPVLTAALASRTADRLANADAVFVGVVVDQTYRMSEDLGDAGLHFPHTFVTFEVVEGLAAVGTGERVTLRFGGGIVDDKALTISEVPRFALGDEVLALAYGNGETACPLVACQEGLVRQPDAALLDHVVAELQGLALPGTVDLDPDAPFAVRKDDPGRPPLVFPALAREARPLPDGVTRRAPVDDPAEEACLERNAHNPALPAGC